MTNDELKKKIVKVLQELRASKPIVPNDYGLQIISCTTDREIADSLIAAGIGDVSELKKHRVVAEYSIIPEDGNAYVLPNTPIRVKQLYSGEEVEQIVKERSEYKRRAERAEKALSSLVHEMYEHDIRPMCDEKFFIESRLIEAEKELVEEEKDD